MGRQSSFFEGADYDWQKTQSKMPIGVFESDLQWHSTVREDWSNVMRPTRAVHSGSPTAARDRASDRAEEHRTNYWPVHPGPTSDNVIPDFDANRISRDPRFKDSPKGVRYTNKVEGKGSVSVASPPKNVTTLEQVAGAEGLRPHLGAKEFTRHHGLAVSRPRGYEARRNAKRVEKANPKLF